MTRLPLLSRGTFRIGLFNTTRHLSYSAYYTSQTPITTNTIPSSLLKEQLTNALTQSSTKAEESLVNSSEETATSEPAEGSIETIGVTEGLTDAQRASMKRDPLLSLVVNLVMKNGEKSKAEKLVAKSLYLIRERTSLNPYTVLSDAVEKASPLMITSTMKLGSKVTIIPTAVPQRKRHRISINWIIKAAEARRNPTFPQRFANELISILNGDSSVLLNKEEVHKLVLANRSNAIVNRRR